MNKDPQEIEWYNKICSDFKSPLLAFINRITKNESQSQEIVQETFLKLWTKDFKEINNYIAPWLYTVAKNQTTDLYRKQKHSEKVVIEVISPFGVENSIDAKNIFNKIQSLPLDQQEVIILKFKEGLSYKEIAEITKKNVSLVGVLIHNGLKTLTEDFKEVHNE